MITQSRSRPYEAESPDDVAVEVGVSYRRWRELALMVLLCGDMAESVLRREETSSQVPVCDDDDRVSRHRPLTVIAPVN